ncbi:MAG: FHA domain-containing protein [Betaproteobacteria bacterium]|nr:MAG: FHA domain-containing protein [Betaproteobacteria bacterium]
MSKLVLYLPDGTTLDIPLARERTTIGRRADNDICLPNLAVSGEHAVVVTILADSFLEDLNSTNGTLVNGNPVGKHFLRDRDQIDIGRHKLVYCVDDDAAVDAEVLAGMARISARDFGERVEPAKPFARAYAKAPDLAPAQEHRQTERDIVGGAASVQPAEGQAMPTAASAEPTRKTTSGAATAPAAPPPPSASQQASLKLLSGINAGALVGLTKAETTVGRPGVQVAVIVQAGTSFRLKPVEGASPPRINGKPVDGEGIQLAHGDTIEIAGARLEFVDPPSAAAQDVAAERRLISAE